MSPGLGKSVENGVRETCSICAARIVKTIRSRRAQFPPHVMCSVPRAHHVTAQGIALGKCLPSVKLTDDLSERMMGPSYELSQPHGHVSDEVAVFFGGWKNSAKASVATIAAAIGTWNRPWKSVTPSFV